MVDLELMNPGINMGRKPPKRKIQRRRKIHCENGFPHLSMHSGMCMCLDECCQWDDRGCVCTHCPCNNGIQHGEPIKEKEVA